MNKITKKQKTELIKSEIIRLQTNRDAVQQDIDRKNQYAHQFNMSREYYAKLSEQITNKISIYNGFIHDYRQRHEYDPTEFINLSEETKQLHEDLQSAYKDASDYLKELRDMVDRKKEESLPEKNLTEKPKAEMTFEDFVSPQWKKSGLSPTAKALQVELKKMVGIRAQREHLAKTIKENEGKILIIKIFSDFIKTLSDSEISKTEIDAIRIQYNLLKNNTLQQDA